MSRVETLEQIFDVRGRRALVTGAASGLGQAIAEVLADCGARVTLVDVHPERLAEVSQSLAARGGDVRTALVDVSDPDAIAAAFEELVAEQGGVDVVFANAGIGGGPGFAAVGGERLDTVANETWRRVLAVNLDGVLYTMRAAAAVMKRQRSGRIVATASAAGLGPEALVSYVYAASKGAVVNMAKQAALELAPYGVHVNVIAPGPIKTRIGGGVTPELEKGWASLVPLGRMGEADELKGLALLLASPASSFMVGSVIAIDGGQLLHEPGGRQGV